MTPCAWMGLDNKVKVIVFDGVDNGGILQFSAQIHKTLLGLGIDSTLFVPDSSNPMPSLENVRAFDKVKSANPRNASVKAIAQGIRELSPDCAIFTDCGLVPSQLVPLLPGIETVVAVHDPTPHLSFKEGKGIKDRIVSSIKGRQQKTALDRAGNILLLSESSRQKYSRLHPEYASKLRMIRLGAHVPEAEVSCPPEFGGLDDFHLFFGRIDKYKGLDDLVRAFSQSNSKKPLVIAGSGPIDEETSKAIEDDPRIYLANRFIPDGEMIWLFEHALFAVLPYREASQSGVLPIAYHFGVPVIASALGEFDEYIVEGATGLRYSDFPGLTAIFDKDDIEALGHSLSVNAKQFEKRELDWAGQLSFLLEDLAK